DIAAQLTSYRRWLLRHRRDEPMPLVYNDFMNTLMGQPSTQALIPLVKEAGALGLDVFCIDAGWFASPAIGDWWATIGEWNEAKEDRKSTRLNSSHVSISYAVFCLQK